MTHLKLVSNVTVNKQAYSLPTAWENAVQNWLSWLRLSGCRETTLTVRRGQVRSIARQSHTSHPAEITLATLVTLCGRPGLSADSRHGQRAALVSFYAWAKNNDIVTDDPTSGLPRVKANRPQPRPTPDAIWRALIDSAAPREALMAHLAAECGLRRAEVAGLHYDDLVRDTTGWSLIIRGKGGRQRVVPITDPLARRLRAHCPGGYVFPGQIDGHLSPDCVGRAISRLMPKGWTMHKLRHRFATRGFNGTHNLLAVQEALGHSSVATTQRYTAVAMTDVRAVCEAAADHDSDLE